MNDSIRVCNIQRLCVNDGPGVRTTVFLKGCYLRCPWCCNPEAISYDDNVFFIKDDCCKYLNDYCYNHCSKYGGKRNRTDCPYGCYEKTYSSMSSESLGSVLIKDISIYRNGGGVTFSGGEPLYQAEQILTLLAMLKSNRIHIALETSLFAPHDNFVKLKIYVDYWLVDLKFQFGFITYPSNNIICSFDDNLAELQETEDASKIRYRMVIMHEMFINEDTIIERLKNASIKNVELLGVHNLAKNKYYQLGWSPVDFHIPNDTQIRDFRNKLMESGITSLYVGL